MDERDRRHKRDFEPPPWEQEAFERFEKDRREREEEAKLDAALEAARVASAVLEPAPEEPEVAEPSSVEAAVRVEAPREPAPEQKESAISTAELETMLLGLRHEEPTATKNYKTIANAVSALLVVGGIGFVVWAAVLFARVGGNQGPMPTLASMLLMVWGFLLMGGAVLLFRKYNL